MRDGWRGTTLGALCTITKGTSPTQKTLPGAYPLIVTGPEPLSSNSFQFDGEAICVPLVSSTGHGHASLKRVHYASGRFAVANIVAACVPRAGAGVEAQFLFHYLQHFKDAEIVTRMKGTANVSLSITNLATVPVALPPLDEQRRIVDLIAAVDDVVDAAEAEAVAAVASAVDLRNVYFTDDAAMMPIGEVAEVTAGKQLQSRSAVGEPTPYLRAGNIANGSLDLSVMKEMTLTQPERAKLALRDGDVVVVEGGNGFGKSAIWRATLPGVVAYQNHVLRLRVAQDSYPTEYLSHWARWCHEQGHFRPTGSGIPNIGLGRARSMPIRISESETLPDELLAASAADAAADGARATADTLRTLRSDLLTVLVSGEHEIPASYDAMMGEVA
jgi:type I restriction enzyme S subunit